MPSRYLLIHSATDNFFYLWHENFIKPFSLLWDFHIWITASQMTLPDCNSICLKLPKLNKCCFCIEVKKGSALLGIFLGIEGFYRLTWAIIGVMRYDEMPNYTLAGAVFVFVMASINFLCIFLFLIGMISETTWLLIPLLYLNLIYNLSVIMLLPATLIYIGWVQFLMTFFEAGEFVLTFFDILRT